MGTGRYGRSPLEGKADNPASQVGALSSIVNVGEIGQFAAADADHNRPFDAGRSQCRHQPRLIGPKGV
jgi:hypothetical protein